MGVGEASSVLEDGGWRVLVDCGWWLVPMFDPSGGKESKIEDAGH